MAAKIYTNYLTGDAYNKYTENIDFDIATLHFMDLLLDENIWYKMEVNKKCLKYFRQKK